MLRIPFSDWRVGESMSGDCGIRRAHSRALDAGEAVREFCAEVAQADMVLVVFFCSGEYDLGVLAREMSQRLSGIPVIGCTTAGEIGPAGYLEHSLSGASFSAAEFKVACARLENLQTATPSSCHAFVVGLHQGLEAQGASLDAESCFAWMMIDGLSVREEPVARFLQSALGQISLIGGSAGDGKRFRQTFTYFNGVFSSDSAVVALVSTSLPFRLLKTQGIEATEERLVVTEADPARRMVKELNGLPAAQEYARVLGVSVAALNDEHFMQRPLIMLINNIPYARSIQRVGPDGALYLYCAIDNGLVLRVGRCHGLLENLERELAATEAEIGKPQLILGGDCLHRKLEMDRGEGYRHVETLLLQHRVTGFGTYGEQFRGIHINQTFVGVAIGAGQE